MRRKILALLLAAATALGAVPTVSAQAAGEDDYDIAVHYDMSHSNGKLTDQSGNGNDAVLHNITDDDFKQELDDTYLKLPGGAGDSGAYADLPLSITDDITDYSQAFSVEVTFIPQTAQHQFLWTLGTGDSTDYLFLNPKRPDNNVFVGVKTDTTEESMSSEAISTKQYTTVTVTSAGQTLRLYVNGEYKSTVTHTRDLSRLFAGNGTDILGYIGKSNWGADPYCDAIVTDFKIYNQTLTDDQVKSIYDSSDYVYATQLIEDDIASLDLGNLSAVTEDLILPSTCGDNGSSVTWVSRNEAVLGSDGKITPAAQTTMVELTGTFSLYGVSAEKTYQVYVVGTGDRLDMIMDQYLVLPYYMTAADSLPLEVLGAEVTWESDSADVNTETGVITPSQEGVYDVNLTASVTVNGETEEKEFQVKVLGTDSAYVMSYTREADSSLGGMYTEDVSKSMHLGYSEDGETWRALLNNTGVLFAKAQGETTKLLQDPYIFRMKDGSFGILAVRVNKGGTVSDEAGTLLFFTSDDLVHYTEVGTVRPGTTQSITDPACTYDAVRDNYRLTWKDADTGLTYANTTSDFSSFSEAEISAPLSSASADADIEYSVPGNVAGVTAEEKTYILNKLDKVVNTGVSSPVLTTTVGEELDLAGTKVTAEYSDGSSAEKTVIWNEEELAAVDFNTEGTYTVNGTVKQISDQTDQNYPFIAGRADPNITEYNGKYYFIATTENNNNLYIRESDTVTGLNEAEDHLVYDVAKGAEYGYDTPTNHWAPELHVLDGQLYIFFSANIGDGFNVQSMLMKLTGDDPTDYNDWGDLRQFLNKDGDPLTEPYGGITLDMTQFTYGGRDYVAWSQRNFGKNGGTADIWIGEIDREKPYQLISDAVKLINCEYGWERNNTFVDEGPFTIITDDTLYMTYSGGATDDTYCVGMTSISLDENTDFLNPDNWQKSNYPILTGLSVEGYNGPGHNSYVTDEDGNLINVFHARDDVNWTPRDTFLRIVHFGADGEPILDMTEEREILPENKNVTLTVQVKAAGTEEPDYEILEGADGKWTLGSEENYSFKLSGSADKFSDVKVNDEVLDTSYYTLDEENMTVTLSAEYLESLSADDYTVTFVYEDGQVSTTLTICESTSGGDEPGTDEPGTDEPGTDKPGTGTDDPDQQNPSGKPGAGQNDGTAGGDTKGDSDVKTVQTGDTTNITVWIIMMTAAAFGAGAAAYVKKKRNR